MGMAPWETHWVHDGKLTAITGKGRQVRHVDPKGHKGREGQNLVGSAIVSENHGRRGRQTGLFSVPFGGCSM